MQGTLLGIALATLTIAAPAFAQTDLRAPPTPEARANADVARDLARSRIEAVSSRGLSPGHAARVSPRIVNGVPERFDGQWAWTVTVSANGMLCGGALVTPHLVTGIDGRKFVRNWVARQSGLDWVVTAAHCLTDNNGQEIPVSAVKVLAGTLTLASGPRSEHDVERMRRHPAYDDATLDNDIALLRITAPTNVPSPGTKLSSIRIASDMDIGWLYTPYAALTAHGWGRTAEGGQISDFLQKVVVPYVDRETCENAYRQLGYVLSDSMFCAGYSTGGYDSCSGDSGGPIEFVPTAGGVANPVNEPVLAGVVSWGEGCARRNSYGVYTSLIQMRPWLEETVIDLLPSS